MITYVLTLSREFPAYHPKKGQPTYFKDKVNAAINQNADYWPKVHTIRANYLLWTKRFEKIDKGEACLSIRQWTGKPRHSPQVELFRLTKEDGIGLQRMKFSRYSDGAIYMDCAHIEGRDINGDKIAYNDGLSYIDWQRWFKGYDLSQPLAIIHFTKARY